MLLYHTSMHYYFTFIWLLIIVNVGLKNEQLVINKDDEALDQEEEENVVDELPEKVDEILQVKHKASCNLIVKGNVDLTYD